ncbi:MAG: hypothetical protein ABIQ59_06235 [Nocardioidaceae bacterium]
MNLFALLLVAVVVAVAAAYVAVYLTRVVRDDGAHSPRRSPPASHHTDAFDPRSRLA